jgi:hypothetical protein
MGDRTLETGVGVVVLDVATRLPPGVLECILDRVRRLEVRRARWYEEAGEHALEMLQRSGCVGIVAITPSGNGVQIFVNQNSNSNAVSCSRSDLLLEAIGNFDARVVEIPCHIVDDEVLRIVEEFISLRLQWVSLDQDLKG